MRLISKQELDEANKTKTPFIEHCCEFFLPIYSQSTPLYEKIKTDIAEKISFQFQNLIGTFEKKLLSIKNDLHELMLKSLNDEEKEQQDQVNPNQDNDITLQDMTKLYENAFKTFNQDFQAILTTLQECLKKAEQSNLSKASFQAELIATFSSGLQKYLKIRDEYKLLDQIKIKPPASPQSRSIGSLFNGLLVLSE